MKYYGNAHKAGCDVLTSQNIFEDLKKGLQYLMTIMQNIFPSEHIPLNNKLELTHLMVSITKDNTNLQNEFQNRIKRYDICEIRQSAPASGDRIKYVFGKNIFTNITFTDEVSYKSLSCDIPKYLEFIDIDGNTRNYKLVSTTCITFEHFTSCIMTNNEKILHINDSRISVYDFEDAQERLLNGKGSYQAGFLNYREI